MILQALVSYHQRLSTDDEVKIAPEGFEKKEIPFLIILNQNGEFIDLQDTRYEEGKNKKSRTFLVPRGVKRSSGIVANLLWDNPSYVLGYPSKNETEKNPEKALTRAKEQHRQFIKRIKDQFPDPEFDVGINAVLKFLEKGNFQPIFSHNLWKEVKQTGGNLTFKLVDDVEIVCQRKSVIDSLIKPPKIDTSKFMCLVTGEYDTPAILHAPIKGVKNAQPSGANIVSFNLDPFCSYGKKQGLNAPIGKKAEFAYTSALNYLLQRDSTQKIIIGDATVVFWADRKNKMEEVFANFFGIDSSSRESLQDYKNLLSVFRSPETGVKAELNQSARFYVLGLSPNASRLSIRLWYAGTVGDIVNNISQHFDDLEIIKSEKDWHTVDLRSILRSTSIQDSDEKIPPNLAGDTMKSILNGTPYPATLLSGVLNRIKAEQSRKDKNGKAIPNVNYTRAAIIKAIINRNIRQLKINEKEVTVSLDTTNTNTGYLLGRLFAILEKIQEAASPGLNTTIRDTYYGAASSTPVTVFPRLMKLKNYHLAKIENKGVVVNYEKQIEEITSKLSADNPFPVYLNLHDQGRFSIGYYHQRQEFFSK